MDSNIVVNMPKARNIHMNQIRIMRNIELEKKDVDMLRALESGNTGAQATISTEKQTLRDIPATFDLTTDTTEELKIKYPVAGPPEYVTKKRILDPISRKKIGEKITGSGTYRWRKGKKHKIFSIE